MWCTFCHLYQFILLVGSNSLYKPEKRRRMNCIICVHSGTDPGPLVRESDALTARPRGQIVCRPKDLVQSPVQSARILTAYC